MIAPFSSGGLDGAAAPKGVPEGAFQEISAFVLLAALAAGAPAAEFGQAAPSPASSAGPGTPNSGPPPPPQPIAALSPEMLSFLIDKIGVAPSLGKSPEAAKIAGKPQEPADGHEATRGRAGLDADFGPANTRRAIASARPGAVRPNFASG
jgi:hypothetical protein